MRYPSSEGEFIWKSGFTHVVTQETFRDWLYDRKEGAFAWLRGMQTIQMQAQVKRLVCYAIICSAAWSPLGARCEPDPERRSVVVRGSYSVTRGAPVPVSGVPTNNQGVFEVTLDTRSWTASFRSETAKEDQRVLYSQVEASSDGTNVYVVRTLNPLVTRDDGTNAVVRTEATIYTGAQPPPMERETYHLWLAFVSGSIWTNGNGTAKPPNVADLSLFYHPENWCTYSWADSRDGSRKLVLKSEDRVLTRNFRKDGEIVFHSLKPPFQDGFMLAEGRWFAQTNVLGIAIPTHCQFLFFAPGISAQNASDLEELYSFACHTAEVGTGVQKEIPLGLQEDRYVFVTDRRFGKEGVATLTYGLKGKWSQYADQTVKDRLRTAPRQSLETQALQQYGFNSNRSFELTAARITIGILAVSPLLFLAVKRFLSSTKKLKQKQP